jgi:hypothetical protein
MATKTKPEFKDGEKVLVDVRIEAYYRTRGVEDLKATVVRCLGPDVLGEIEYSVRVEGAIFDEVRRESDLRRAL